MSAAVLQQLDELTSVPDVETLRSLMRIPRFVRRPARCRCSKCGEPLACDASVFAPGAPLCPHCNGWW